MRYLFFIFLSFALSGQIPDYYASVDFTLSPQEVEQQLADLVVTTHTTQLTYTPDVWDALKITDLDPSDETHQTVLLFYGYNDDDSDFQTDRSRDKDDNCTSSSCNGLWNREHVYPRSLGTPDLGFENAGADAHALRACDSGMNSSRSNRVFADGAGNALITPLGHFYPGDEWKGDVARMMMYMYLHYPTQAVANTVAYSTNNYDVDMPDVFLEWNEEDPVSEYEMQRNNHLQTVQGNRNPFIDNPYLATLIWGGPEAPDTFDLLSIDEIETVEIEVTLYPNPTQEKVFYTTDTKPIKVTIYNTNGQRVGTDEDLTDNAVSLPSKEGVYLIQFEFDHQTQTHQVMVAP